MRADRLLAELNLLQARGRMTASELAIELEVTERTVYRDMYALQVAGVPLVSARGRSGGYELFGDWRSDLTGLTARELESLLTAAALAPDGRLGSTGVSAAAKLAAIFPQPQADELDRLRRRFHIESGEEADTKWAAVVEAIRRDRALVLTLQRIPSRLVERVGHPIGLILNGRDWYLVWHEGDGKPRIGGRGEIAAAAVSNASCISAGPIDLGGVWRRWSELRRRAARRYRVRVRVDIAAIERWRARHSVLAEVAGTETVEVTTGFGSIHEACAAVLSWGGSVEIISPPALRLMVSDYARETLSKYSGAAPYNSADMKTRIVVMGVAGSGKTTIGELLADHLGATFVDGDSVHPPANVAKMAAGEALTDEDRLPWLEGLRDRLRSEEEIVVACSALRRRYRDVLRTAGDVVFLYLDVDEEEAWERVAGRKGHFMGPGMVGGQFALLEQPGIDESDVITVDATGPIDEVVGAVLTTLGGV